MVRREYCYGIYRYTDKENGEIVYIGKDSHINKNRRHIQHFLPSRYKEQPINRILQNNPDRYKYDVWYHVSDIDELNQLEFDLINLYRPKFNFRHGGEGKSFTNEFKYNVIKAGRTRQNKQIYTIEDVNRKPIIASIDYNYVEEICKKLNQGKLTPQQAKRIKRSIKPSLKTNLQKSKSTNSSGFYRVSKSKRNKYKQCFLWTYVYYDENKKRKKIRRVNLFELKEEVENRGLLWKCIDVNKATNTIKSLYNIA